MSEHRSPQPLSAEQLKIRDQRVIHEADLIAGGARHVAEGRIQPTFNQIDSLHEEAMRDEFEASTTGQRLRGHLDDLQDIETRVGKEYLDWVRRYPIDDGLSQPRGWVRRYPIDDGLSQPHAWAANDYLQRHGINVDLVDLVTLNSHTDITRQEAAAREVKRDLRQRIDSLDTLKPTLIDNPNLRIGATVTLPIAAPSGRSEDIIMAAHYIVDLRANGTFLVSPIDPSAGLPPTWSIDVRSVAAANPLPS